MSISYNNKTFYQNKTNKPQNKPCHFPIIFIPDCAFLLIKVNLWQIYNHWLESGTRDKNFLKLPDCETLKYIPSNKKPVNGRRGRPNTSTLFMASIFKSILLKCPIKNKEQNKAFCWKRVKKAIGSLCLFALTSILSAQMGNKNGNK